MKICIFIFMLTSCFAAAHPVIYKDGFVYWGEFSHQENTQRFSYTFHPHFALQISSNFEKKNFNTHQLGLNILVQRWLLSDSQANIYTSLKSGFYTDSFVHSYETKKGVSSSILERLTFQWDLSADWESRFIYTSGKATLKRISSTPKTLWGDFEYRIGFAPYTANMDVLQTWFVVMFQSSGLGTKNLKNTLLTAKNRKFQYHRKTLKLNSSAIVFDWKITPLLRFFYKNVLWEIGSSLQNDFYLTLMVHY